jgi:UDP-N-acetylglucosamine 2-epimerase
MLEAIEKVLMKEQPDAVVVFGDTNTTVAGALAAAKMSILVAHVEAGMRSFVNDMPEEINRRLTDHMTDLLLCPTEVAVANARKEGIKRRIVKSGDLMYQLLHQVRPMITGNRKLLERFKLRANQYVLLTAHRAANVDSDSNLLKLVEIIESIPHTVLFPVHPRTRARLHESKLWHRLNQMKSVILTEPLSYIDTLTAARFAHAVLTDSGGLQKEALFLGTVVLTLRDETEWVETLKWGNRLVGLSKVKVKRGLRTNAKVKRIAYRIDGRAPSQIMVRELENLIRKR